MRMRERDPRDRRVMNHLSIFPYDQVFFTLLGREVKSFFYSPIAYVVMCFFLFLTGFAFYIGVSLLNRGPTDVTVIQAFFNTILFWIAYLLIFPLITMRSFSEEFKHGDHRGVDDRAGEGLAGGDYEMARVPDLLYHPLDSDAHLLLGVQLGDQGGGGARAGSLRWGVTCCCC